MFGFRAVAINTVVGVAKQTKRILR